jgi:hypothetical protein
VSEHELHILRETTERLPLLKRIKYLGDADLGDSCLGRLPALAYLPYIAFPVPLSSRLTEKWLSLWLGFDHRYLRTSKHSAT